LAGGTSSTLVETCERILENHDEKITAYLYKTVKKNDVASLNLASLQQTICKDVTNVCESTETKTEL